jgi:hypothetical protein
MEVTLVHLLLSHGVKLYPTKFLTRCVVCNGQIGKVTDATKAKEILVSQQAPEHLNNDDMDVFQCNGCDQGYWWSERPNSSASRVKDQTTRLFEACIRGGVPIDEDLGFFDYVDVDKVKQEGSDDTDEEVELLLQQRLDVLDWLQQEELKAPFGSMASAYADDEGKERLPWTNVTADFEGTLDFIFYKTNDLELVDTLYVPTTYEELNSVGVTNGHLLPSNVWPSDHLAIGSRFRFARNVDAKTPIQPFLPSGTREELNSSMLFCAPTGGSAATQATTNPTPAASANIAPAPTIAMPTDTPNVQHGQRCACGCVPNVLSMFEMAELRKKARLKQTSYLGS